MACKDLCSFLETLEKEGQLIRIKDEVMPEPDISAICTANNKGIGETAPALLFEKINGFPDDVKLVANTHGSWRNIALAFGLPKDTSLKEICDVFNSRYQDFDKGTIEEKDSAPWQEVVIEGDDINLFELMPHFRLNPGDGGMYINKSCITSRHPDHMDDFDQQNVGMYRLQVKGPRNLSIQMVPEHDIALHSQAAERENKPLPVAIAIANDPILPLVASMPLLYNQDEFQMASALIGEPYPVLTLENGLQVTVWVLSTCWKVMFCRVCEKWMDPMVSSQGTYPAPGIWAAWSSTKCHTLRILCMNTAPLACRGPRSTTCSSTPVRRCMCN
jgi:4-hydroxybenzoate decarboxylase